MKIQSQLASSYTFICSSACKLVLQILSNQLFLVTFKKLGLLIGFSLMVGCAQSNVKLYKNQQALQSPRAYSQIYLLQSANDPLDVMQRIAAQFQAQGYPVNIFSESVIQAPQGSGVIFSPKGHILTCAHVLYTLPKNSPIGQKTKVWVQGEAKLAEILYVDRALDLALLQLLPLDKWPFVPLSREPHYQLGQSIYAFGYPLSPLLGTSTRVTQGIVSARVGFQDEQHHFQVSAAIQPGNSGGPIVNTQGEVLGIVQSTLNSIVTSQYTGGIAPQNVNFAVNQQSIHQFLKEAQHFTGDRFTLINGQVIDGQLIHSQPLEQSIGLTQIDGLAAAEAASVRIQAQDAPNPLPGEQVLGVSIRYDKTQPNKVAREILNTILHTTGRRSNTSQSKDMEQTDLDQEHVKNFSLVLFDFTTQTPLYQMNQTSDLALVSSIINETLQQITPILAATYYPINREQACNNCLTDLTEQAQPVASALSFAPWLVPQVDPKAAAR